jgi:hypothetical protein
VVYVGKTVGSLEVDHVYKYDLFRTTCYEYVSRTKECPYRQSQSLV